MTAMAFKLRGEPDQRLDLSALTPDRLNGLSEAAVAALPLHMGKTPVTVGDVFRIIMGDVADIRIDGSERLDHVGAGLTRGRLTVEGGVGAYAGRAMAGGELKIQGNAGPYAGSILSGGLVHIGGEAGDFLGGPRPGEMRGMRGGTVAAAGRAGDRAGDRMRRGLIVIGGDAGDFPGSRMIAGTVAILGGCGRLPGYLMRRGTIVLGGDAASWAPTFAESGVAELTVMRLIAREVKTLMPSAAVAVLEGSVRRFAGDLAISGKGEIIRPA